MKMKNVKKAYTAPLTEELVLSVKSSCLQYSIVDNNQNEPYTESSIDIFS